MRKKTSTPFCQAGVSSSFLFCYPPIRTCNDTLMLSFKSRFGVLLQYVPLHCLENYCSYRRLIATPEISYGRERTFVDVMSLPGADQSALPKSPDVTGTPRNVFSFPETCLNKFSFRRFRTNSKTLMKKSLLSRCCNNDEWCLTRRGAGCKVCSRASGTHRVLGTSWSGCTRLPFLLLAPSEAPAFQLQTLEGVLTTGAACSVEVWPHYSDSDIKY